MSKKTKRAKRTKSASFFMVMTLVIWLAIVIMSFLVLKTGGHLYPKAAGQEGNIALGKVVQLSGKGVGSAKLTLLKDGKRNYLFADSGGNFRVENMVVGTYSVLVEANGFRPYESSVVIDDNMNSYSFTLSKE